MGGAQKYVFTLASLAKEHFDVVVAFGGGGSRGDEIAGALKTKLEEEGIRTIFIPELCRDVHHLHELRSAFKIYKIIRKERPDILHVNSSKAAGEGSFAGRLAGVKKIIYTVHGLPENEERPFIEKFLIRFSTWLTFILAHKVITISKRDEAAAKRYFFVKNKISMIYNGIKPLTLESGEIIRQEFPSGVKILGTIGELTKNKNQKTLIEDAKNNANLYVAIVGEGEERKNLELLIEKYNLGDRVKLFGFLPQTEVLRGFDTFALPSIKEGLPYVLIEAKMAGLPIIANRIGAVGEILDATDMREFSLERMLEKTFELY